MVGLEGCKVGRVLDSPGCLMTLGELESLETWAVRWNMSVLRGFFEEDVWPFFLEDRTPASAIAVSFQVDRPICKFSSCCGGKTVHHTHTHTCMYAHTHTTTHSHTHTTVHSHKHTTTGTTYSHTHTVCVTVCSSDTLTQLHSVTHTHYFTQQHELTAALVKMLNSKQEFALQFIG